MKNAVWIFAVLMIGCASQQNGITFNPISGEHAVGWVMTSYQDRYPRIIKIQELVQYHKDYDKSWRVTHYVRSSQNRLSDMLEFITDKGRTSIKATGKQEHVYGEYYEGEYTFPIGKDFILRLAEANTLAIVTGDGARYEVTPEGIRELKGLKHWVYY